MESLTDPIPSAPPSPEESPQNPMECPICMNIIHQDDMYITPCIHFFHVKCIEAYKQTGHNDCPMCRSILQKEEKNKEDEKETHQSLSRQMRTRMRTRHNSDQHPDNWHTEEDSEEKNNEEIHQDLPVRRQICKSQKDPWYCTYSDRRYYSNSWHRFRSYMSDRYHITFIEIAKIWNLMSQDDRKLWNIQNPTHIQSIERNTTFIRLAQQINMFFPIEPVYSGCTII